MSSVAATSDGSPAPVGLADLDAAAEGLAGLAAGLVAEAVPLCEVGRWWETVQRLVRVAGSLETLLAARLAESGGWKQAGYRHPAEQIAALGGTGLGAARELLVASEQVSSLPGTEQAVRAGDLSAAETATIASAASANPEAEESLLDLLTRAAHGPYDLGDRRQTTHERNRSHRARPPHAPASGPHAAAARPQNAASITSTSAPPPRPGVTETTSKRTSPRTSG